MTKKDLLKKMGWADDSLEPFLPDDVAAVQAVTIETGDPMAKEYLARVLALTPRSLMAFEVLAKQRKDGFGRFDTEVRQDALPLKHVTGWACTWKGTSTRQSTKLDPILSASVQIETSRGLLNWGTPLQLPLEGDDQVDLEKWVTDLTEFVSTLEKLLPQAG